jgi:hypothetical protein
MVRSRLLRLKSRALKRTDATGRRHPGGLETPIGGACSAHQARQYQAFTIPVCFSMSASRPSIAFSRAPWLA